MLQLHNSAKRRCAYVTLLSSGKFRHIFISNPDLLPMLHCEVHHFLERGQAFTTLGQMLVSEYGHSILL
jgi:hypothetical protein